MSKKRAFLGLILGFLTVVLISVAIPFLYMKKQSKKPRFRRLFFSFYPDYLLTLLT